MALFRSRLPTYLQSELADCGLACMAMIATYYGRHTSIIDLRRQYPVSQKGTSFRDLVDIAGALKMSTRGLTVELPSLNHVRTPAVLHWDFKHFVVLDKVKGDKAVIHDPTMGRRVVALSEVGKHFTGAVLEVFPAASFEKKRTGESLTPWDLLRGMYGMRPLLAHAVIAALCLELFMLLSPLLLQFVFDRVIPANDREVMLGVAAAYFLVVLIQQVAFAFRGWTINVIRASVSLQLGDRVFTRLLRLPVPFFERRSLGDLVSRFLSVAAIQRSIANNVLEALVDGALSAVVIFVMYLYSPLLATLAVVSAALAVVCKVLWYWPTRYANEMNLAHQAKQQMYFMETMRGIRSVKLFRRQEERRGIWLNEYVEQIGAEARSQELQVSARATSNLITGADRILAVAIGAVLVMDQELSLGALS